MDWENVISYGLYLAAIGLACYIRWGLLDPKRPERLKRFLERWGPSPDDDTPAAA